MGSPATVPSCAQHAAGVPGGEFIHQLHPEQGWSSRQGSVTVKGCVREGRRTPCSPQALHNGGLFGTNSFPINYVI